MRRFYIAGLALVCALGLASLASAQPDSPPAEESPFDPARAPVSERRASTGHQIELTIPLAKEMSLEERLQAKASFHAQEASLDSFADALEKALDVSVVLAVKKLEEAAMNLETPLSYKLKNVRIQTALSLILQNLGLTYDLREDVLVITTPDDAASRLVIRVYDCRDLLKLPSPIKRGKRPKTQPGQPEIGTANLPAPLPEKKEEATPDGGYEVADLIEVIIGTVTPDSWEDVGGPGSVKDFKGLITLSQTQEVHEDVEKLLNMLHKAGGLEEKVKVSR